MRYCLPHTAWLKLQDKKGVRATCRLVLDLDTLRDSSTVASEQHSFEVPGIGEKLKGSLLLRVVSTSACALTCGFPCQSPPYPPTLPTLVPFFSLFSTRQQPPPRARTPPPMTPTETRTPLRKLPPVKTTHYHYTHKKITESIPNNFGSKIPPPKLPNILGILKNKSVRDLLILCSLFLPRPLHSRNKSVR